MQDLGKNLLTWFQKHGRKNLPWRKKNISPYEVWVSEIFLQQTQVSRVISYYKKFLKRFPNVRTLAKARWSEFLPYYEGLGYYRRGRNMLETARIIVRKFNGRFPKEKIALMRLPGIGEYTANAILSFAYQQDVLAFDTNFQRVFGRYFSGDRKGKVDREKLQKELIADKRTFNAAVMDFSNAVCVKNPKCEICPLSRKCLYFKEQGRKEYRHFRQKTFFPTKKAQVFLWLHKNHKLYYSSQRTHFEPFILPAEFNTRDGIKQYFKDTYKLKLAVRPPHKKIFIKRVPTIFVNAQILLGRPKFSTFHRSEALKWRERCGAPCDSAP